MSPSIEKLVLQAQGGSKAALADVIARVQDQIYGLALRMLWHPEDARDAAQEILIRNHYSLGKLPGRKPPIYDVGLSCRLELPDQSAAEPNGATSIWV